MFCDLVGSTALSTELDPEDLRAVIGVYHRCCAEFVERNRGFVAKYMGDGVLAYFGYPQAHEHDAERAVSAGLGLVQAVPLLPTSIGSPLQVRVGIATGLVVVGDLIGAGSAQEQAVVGETPNLAARLQALAEPGTIVIDASTRRLLADLFEYHDLGAIEVKGFAAPVQAHQVIRQSAVDSRFEAFHAMRTPLVGREEEIDLLMRRWQQAKGGDGSVVLISGEPGIGKSRIAQTVLERLSGEPHMPLRLFCSPHHQASALYPTITQLERAAGFRRDDTDLERLDKMEALLGEAISDLSEAAPLIADLLGVPTGDRYPPLNVTSQKRKEKTLRALLAQLEGLATRRPVLMVFEDAHWIDPMSRESLDLTVDRVSTLPVLLIITYRPEFTPPWVGRPHVSLLSLSRLPRRQRAEMIVRVTRGKTLPKEIADQIIDRTDGVPLFVEELTKAIVESGVLVDAGDRYTVSGPLPPLTIPTSLQASLLARLDRLAPAREVAQVGAALGRQFSHELISAIAPIPQQELDNALAQLVSAELILRRGTPPDAEYTFKHALVQDAAYSTLLRSRRQQLHGRIALTLEARFPDIVEQQPEVQARHCTQAGSIKEAIAYWIKAVRKSITRAALEEAIAQTRKGLALLPGLAENPERWRQELELQAALGWGLFLSIGEGVPEAAAAFARARALCEQVGDRSHLGPLLYMQSSYHIARAEHNLARARSEELLQLAIERRSVSLELCARQNMGRSLFWLGAFASATEHFGLVLRARVSNMGDDIMQSFLTVEENRVVALTFLGAASISLGYLDQAAAWNHEALTLGKSCRPYFQTIALAWSGLLSHYCGSDQAAAESFMGLAAIAKEQRLLLAVANLYFARHLPARGEPAEGLERARAAFAEFTAMEYICTRTEYLSVLACCCERAGAVDEALELLETALGQANSTNERFFEAELHRLKGEWLLLHRPTQAIAAESCYQRALAIARGQHAKFWELRAATCLARLWRDQGKRTEARELLAPVYSWFTEGFDTPVLQDAKALLDRLT